MPDVFLSYSREDQATARRFAEALERAGLSVWWDQTLRSGEAYDKVTERALKEARAVVVLWSKRSVDSRWVRAEATIADRNGTLVPVTIEPCERPVMFELTQTADLSRWRGDSGDPTWQAFLADVRRFVEKGSTEAPTVRTVRSPPAAPLRLPPASLATLVIVLLAILAGGAWLLVRDGGSAKTAVAGDSATSTAAVSLAVLPFEDMSAARDQEYLSDGLAEEILNQLAQVKALRLVGRTSSFAFKGRNEDLRTIAGQLDVANLLEGSVRKDGDQLRITAQLIDGATGAHRWSKTYARELRDVFALQEEVARDVARALSVTLDVGEIRRAEGGTTNFEAYDRYLQSRRLFLERSSREDGERCLQLAREAVTLDPQFALGWMHLAWALGTVDGLVTEFRAGLSLRSKEIEEAESRVLALAPDSWWARLIRAQRLLDRREWAQAETVAEPLVKEAPLTAANVQRSIAWGRVLASTGRMREAAQFSRTILQVEPNSSLISGSMQTRFDVVGDSDFAEREYRRSLTLTGNYWLPHFVHLLRLIGREGVDSATLRAQYRLLLAEEGPLPPELLRELARVGNDRAAASAALRPQLDAARTQSVTMVAMLASLADAYGDRELTLAALRRLVFDMKIDVYTWNLFRSGVRADPRFKEIVRESRVDDYWRSSGNWGDFCKPVGADDFECH